MSAKRGTAPLPKGEKKTHKANPFFNDADWELVNEAVELLKKKKKLDIRTTLSAWIASLAVKEAQRLLKK